MYNKNRFRKINNKKVLHKVKKHWVIVSLALLGALGFGSVTAAQGHAAVTGQPDTDQNLATIKNAPQPATAQLIQQPARQVSDNASGANNVNDAPDLNTIQQRANALHQQILTDGIQTVGHHHNSGNDLTSQNQNNGTNSDHSQLNPSDSNQIITGQWGTAPFKFDPATGMLQTTSGGQIVPVTQLNNPKLQLKQIRSIKFAPGTLAPINSSKLFAAGYDSFETTDGPSDGVAYVSQLRNLKNVDLTNLDTGNVTNMAQMFQNDSDLQNINFGPHFDTSNVSAMAGMFQSDLKLQSLDLSHFDTANVLDMTSMFQSDYNLSDINLGQNFNTRYTVYMYNMFRSDNSLKRLNLGNNFSTVYVIDNSSMQNHGFSHMFANDYNLTSLKLSPKFNTGNAKDLSAMFANDSDLMDLDLGSNFYTEQASDIHNLFKGDTQLKALNLGDHFDTTKANTKSYSARVNDKNPYGIPDVTVHYHGADNVFEGDRQLNTLIMNDTKLVPATKLSTPNQMQWYLIKADKATGSPVDLTNDQTYSGIYGLHTNDPVVMTILNFVDDTNHNQLIGTSLVYGLKGQAMLYGTIVNPINDNYQLDLPVKDFIKTFPNMPYQYQSGTINVPVKPKQGLAKKAYANESAASKAMNAADQKIANYYKNSVASSVAKQDQSLASNAAQLADRRIANYYSNSVSASVTNANHKKAELAAQSADRSIASYYQNSVASSVSMENQSKADRAASSADQSIESSIARSDAQRADQQIEQSEQTSVANSESTESNLENTTTSIETVSSVESTPSAGSVASSSQVTLSSVSVSSIGSQSSQPVSRIPTDDTDRNAPVNDLKVGQRLQIGNRIVSRTPVKYRQVRITHTCLAHNHIVSVGKVSDYSSVLNKGTVVQIEKTFRVKAHHQSFNRYEIILNHHHYFVTASSLYATSVYVQPSELKRHRVYGHRTHRYYHAVVKAPCFTYNHSNKVNYLHRGKRIHVKGIVETGRKGHRIERLLLTDGRMITANKKYIKIIN